ncbi:MAG TPA: hypothetical protein VGR80_07390, partial [Steroidobacteraceae bacterium]|nr:hypothetical protein [Steroidobacteraceae bacterium]
RRPVIAPAPAAAGAEPVAGDLEVEGDEAETAEVEVVAAGAANAARRGPAPARRKGRADGASE